MPLKNYIGKRSYNIIANEITTKNTTNLTITSGTFLSINDNGDYVPYTKNSTLAGIATTTGKSNETFLVKIASYDKDYKYTYEKYNTKNLCKYNVYNVKFTETTETIQSGYDQLDGSSLYALQGAPLLKIDEITGNKYYYTSSYPAIQLGAITDYVKNNYILKRNSDPHMLVIDLTKTPSHNLTFEGGKLTVEVLAYSRLDNLGIGYGDTLFQTNLPCWQDIYRLVPEPIYDTIIDTVEAYPGTYLNDGYDMGHKHWYKYVGISKSEKGSYIENVITNKKIYPDDGVGDDGYWYVRVTE